MGCGASKTSPCAPVQVPCSGKTPGRLNSTSKNKKTAKPSPKTTKAGELRRQANEAKLKNSGGLNSSVSKYTKSKLTTSQVSNKVISSPRSTRPKDSRPNSAAKNCHLASNFPRSRSPPQVKTSKTTTEARTASCQSVKSLKSDGTSRSSKDSAVNPTNEARQRTCPSAKKTHSSPTLKKGSPDTIVETKPLKKPQSSQPSKRPTSSPEKRHKQPLNTFEEKKLSCQPERPHSGSSIRQNLSIIKTKAEATQKCSKRTVRPKSSPSNDKYTAERNQTRCLPKERPRSSTTSKGNPIEATNEAKHFSRQSIKRPISSHLSKDDTPKITSVVRRKASQSPKSPQSRAASEGNPPKTTEACETGQHAAQEAETKTDPADEPSLKQEVKKVLDDEGTTKNEVVVDKFQSRAQESSASEAELDYFITEILQSQLNLVQNVPPPDKIPKPLNTRSPTVSSPTPGAGLEQGTSLLATPAETVVLEDNSDCQKKSDSSTEGSDVSEANIVTGVSMITQSTSAPIALKGNRNSEEKSTSPTARDLTIFSKENAHVDSTELIKSTEDEKKSSRSLRSSPSTIKSQEKIKVTTERKSSKTSIDERRSSPTPKPSKSNAKISKSGSNLRAVDLTKDSSLSQTATRSTSGSCSSRSTTDASVGLNRRGSGQRPSSIVKAPEKSSNASENKAHSSTMSFSDLRVSDGTKSPTTGSKSHSQVSVAGSEESLHSSRVQSAEKKGRLTPMGSRGELKDEKKIGGSQDMRRSSSATLSKRSVSRNSSKLGIMSPTSSVADKDLEGSMSNDKIHQMPSEQKKVAKKQSSNREQAEDATSNAKERTDTSHSQDRFSTCSLPKADPEQRPKSGRSVTMGSNSSIVRSEERLSNARTSSPKQPELRNSSSKSSLERRIPSPPEKRNERSGSARSSRHSLRQFEVLDTSKILEFAVPSYPELRSRNSRSKTSLNKMEVLSKEEGTKLP